MEHIMKTTRKVFVAGAANAARSAIVNSLLARGLSEDQIDTKDAHELDLCDQAAVRSYLRQSVPDQIYITSGDLGSPANTDQRRGSHLSEAMLAPVQLIQEALYAGVRKLLFIASDQVYGGCPVLPCSEEDMAFAQPDPLRNPLAQAHIASIRLCEAYTHEFGEVLDLAYRSVVVGNMFGGECFSRTSNVSGLTALMRHIHQAKLFKLSSVSIPSSVLRREDWLHVNDMAEACIGVLGMADPIHNALTRPNRPHLNVGSGRVCTGLELAHAVAKTVGYKGDLNVEDSQEKGTQDGLLDATRMRSTGWQPHVSLDIGLARMYRDYKAQGRKLTSA
ncbi:NAD-dependent epimerase/dehydratase family protein [Hydrogenophaga sp.]|uniref:NAD-dependent epimerase/dehydratase family protein n=1 Tax=Hydrogenophaga sp. TaxID=1904254 RepID=UPI002734DF6C|nr:NAD-dependent epimerase/dehydratase family protein [Hydrogenophaga sp.]